MKVTKLATPNSATPSLPDDAAAGQQMMADLLFNSMLQMNTDAAMESPESPVTGNDTDPTKVQANGGVQASQNAEGTDNSVVIAQLNMLSDPVNATQDASSADYSKLLSNQPVPAVVQAAQQNQVDKSAVLPSAMATQMSMAEKINLADNKTSDVKNNHSQTMNAAFVMNQNNFQTTDAAMAQQDKLNLPSSQSVQNNQNSPINQSTQSNSTVVMQQASEVAATVVMGDAPKQTKSTNLTDPVSAQPVKTPNKELVPSVKNLNQATKKIDLTSIDLALATVQNQTSDATQAEIKKDSTVLNVTQDLSINNQTQPVPAKYTDAFTQMSSLINSQTMQLLNNHEQKQMLDLSTAKTANLTTANSLPQANIEPQIELSAPMISSFQKDSYDAKIKIYPPELGTVTAKLRVGKNNAELVILTDNNHVKSIVEANLPKLRENFQQADINLTTIQVQTSAPNFRDQAEQRQNQQDSPRPQQRDQDSSLGNNNTDSTQSVTKERNTLIDTYA